MRNVSRGQNQQQLPRRSSAFIPAAACGYPAAILGAELAGGAAGAEVERGRALVCRSRGKARGQVVNK